MSHRIPARQLILVSACLVMAVTSMPRSQDLASQYAPLALVPEYAGPTSESFRMCATSSDLMGRTAFGIRTMEALADGRPLRADQFPRFLQPTHTGTFGFNNLLILGDHETITFERLDRNAENDVTVETWQRTGTDSVAGRLVSVFNPSWSADVLREHLRTVRWGVDDNTLFWGEIVVPGTGTVTTAGLDAAEGEDKVTLVLSIVPPDIPESPVTKINDEVQFSSHVVNIWDPDFGDSRVTGGDSDLNETEITQKFYEHFKDEYDVIAIVSQATQIAPYSGYHGNVRNDIAGIGLDLFDNTSFYGSAGALQGIEGYPPGGWAQWSTVLHETAHQWNEYTDTWANVGPAPAVRPSVLDRKGHAPDAHTPLLFPGAVLVGAVLEAERRVAEQDGGFAIERTTPLVTYNALTLYRMGLAAVGALPTFKVFVDQGQFDEESSSAPDVGTAVAGDSFDVTGNDFMAADGARSGPTVTRVRRAIVYVSRAGLVPQGEMNILNYFAARFAAKEGVTSWDRYPSFFEATGGQAEMFTDISPKDEVSLTAAGLGGQTAVKITGGPDVMYPAVPPTALVGVTLDGPIPGRISVGQSVTVSGMLTLTDRSDYNSVCMRFYRYGADDPNEIFTCSSLSGQRFSITNTFTAAQQGTYTAEVFAFWPDSGVKPILS